MKHYTVVRLAALLTVAFVVLGWGGQAASADPPTPRMSSAHYALDWNVIGEISGGGGSSAHYAINQATISQMHANSLSTSANYALCTGWECIQPSTSMHLPLILR